MTDYIIKSMKMDNGKWIMDNGKRKMENVGNGFIRSESVAAELTSVLSNLHILDLCTGSGAIAIALKKAFSSATVIATDISEKALELAKENAILNHTDIIFKLSDLFNSLNTENDNLLFDIIVSNPPYVSDDDYTSLLPELFYEPKIAITADDKGLNIIKQILIKARDYLKENGVLYIEIGHDQGNDITEFAKENNYSNIEIIKDLNNKNRILRCEK